MNDLINHPIVIRVAYIWHCARIITSPAGKWIVWILLALLTCYFTLLGVIEASELKYAYISMAVSCGLLFFSGVVFPHVMTLHDALEDHKAIESHYNIFRIYESPEFARMADDYWRKRLPSLPEGQYVYIIKDASVTGYHKVGKTSNPARRLHRFDVTLPFEIQIISIMPCTNMHQLEAKLHYMFRNNRVRGEWFKLCGVELEQSVALEARLLFIPPVHSNGHTGGDA